ncbi:hypothetical protein LGT39_01130 [Demequina sp. TTPB684]|uniref:hypothetical protein n=1 Tax=unclassified Demequina TaxID=2620311 RepID=UPI001CF17275|nr:MULTISPECIES: hypothetical protein [unclassified Demequina]MCB2411449.1 hypothetical protein [Demequina sp. TTPB684]UPU88823.1 hypothetical protein LGT36_002580 [Demequina sp. TMPB413]
MNDQDPAPLLVQQDDSFQTPSLLRHWSVPLVINLAVAVAVFMVIESGLRYAVAAVLVAGGLVTARTYWVSGQLATGRIALLDGRVREGAWQLAGLSNVVSLRKWVPFTGGGELTLTRTGPEGARAYIVSDGRSSTGFRSAIDWDEASAAPLIAAAAEHGYTVRFEE